MNVGDMVATIEAARSEFGLVFGPVLVTGKRTTDEEEVELLLDDGSIEWYPAWMMKVTNESR